MKRNSATIGVLAAALCLSLAACDQQQGGEAVARAQIGDTPAEPADPDAQPGITTAISNQVESACRSVIFEDTSLTHCLAVPARHLIETRLLADNGAPFRSFDALARTVQADQISFAVNGGSFKEDGTPIGYYVEDSERLQTLDRGTGEGSFYSRPNGIFFGTGTEWQIRTTDDFLANVSQRPEFGTQSGPMLVIDGSLHPDIQDDGPDRIIRNAVGIDDRGRAHFVISNAPLSFGRLARFYRDELRVRNALYLDGEVSSLWNPATERMDGGEALGPIIMLIKKDDAN